MQTVLDMKLSKSAKHGMQNLGIKAVVAVQVVQGLSTTDFYKSMTTYSDHRVWQDVYHCTYRDIDLYIKFQKLDQYFLISFKEHSDG